MQTIDICFSSFGAKYNQSVAYDSVFRFHNPKSVIRKVIFVVVFVIN